MKKITTLFMVFLMFGTVVGAVEYGTHANDAVLDPNIDVKQISYLEYLFRTIFGTQYALYTDSTTYYPGNIVNFQSDVTSYANSACQDTFIIIEIYGNGQFVTSKTKEIGYCNNNNNYYVATIPYTIPSSETRYGEWTASTYLWCDGRQQIMSQVYTTSFVLKDPNQQTCTEGYIGPKECKDFQSTYSQNNMDVYQQYRYTNCDSEWRRVQSCTSSQVCIKTGYDATCSAVTTTTTSTTSPYPTTTTTNQNQPNIVVDGDRTLTVSGRTITMQFNIKNTGASMTSDWIIEMQPRPYGLLPMSVVNTNELCNADYPENVHVNFRLVSGEINTVTLISTVPQDGKYDIYLLSRDKCYSTPPVGNIRVTPFPYSDLDSTVIIGQGNGDNIPIWMVSGGIFIMFLAIGLYMARKDNITGIIIIVIGGIMALVVFVMMPNGIPSGMNPLTPKNSIMCDVYLKNNILQDVKIDDRTTCKVGGGCYINFQFVKMMAISEDEGVIVLRSSGAEKTQNYIIGENELKNIPVSICSPSRDITIDIKNSNNVIVDSKTITAS